jgi:hypothetical protein
MNRCVVVVLSAVGVVMALGTAQAQTIGTFNWQQEPYCNVITLTVVQNGGTFHLDGSDDQCGAARRASASGIAFINPDGSIGIGLTLVTNNGGTVGGLPLHIDATVSPATVSGSWRDSTGQTGPWTFAPGGATSGTPRPLPSTAAIAANSVGTAALQAAAVTTQKLAPNAVTGAVVENGSLTVADLGDAPRIGASASAGIFNLPNGEPPVVVRDVIVTVPAAGRIIAMGSGQFFLASGSEDVARCGVSNTLSLSAPTASVHDFDDSVLSMPFATTAMFPVRSYDAPPDSSSRCGSGALALPVKNKEDMMHRTPRIPANSHVPFSKTSVVCFTPMIWLPKPPKVPDNPPPFGF